MEEMQNQELCILLDSILALLETDNVDKAKEVIQNAINRIDKGMTTSTKEECMVRGADQCKKVCSFIVCIITNYL